MKAVLVVFLAGLAVLLACVPESRYACDDPCGNWTCNDPVCDTICTPKCEPNCICFNELLNKSYPKHCTYTCLPDQCASDNCPTCETHCGDVCHTGYETICEILACGWSCREDPECPQPKCVSGTPTEGCPPPRCELQSEMPACEWNSAGRSSVF